MQLRMLDQLVFEPPNLVDDALDDLDEFRVLLFLVAEEPRAFFCNRHIRRYRHAVMEREVAEVHLVTSVRLKSLILELFEVYKLRLVNDEIVERH